MMYCDAHFHLVPCLAALQKNEGSAAGSEQSAVSSDSGPLFPEHSAYCGCTCAHDEAEFLKQENEISRIHTSQAEVAGGESHGSEAIRIVSAFGMHPQMPLIENARFMEELLRGGRIGALGEAGFDNYPPYKEQTAAQEDAWRIQIELAAKYAVPLIVHCRKAQDKLFRDSSLLAKIPAVVFHSFAGSVQDARSLLRHGIHGYFSFGKPLLQGDKSAVRCIKELPAETILLETDAPYQTLRNERFTVLNDIVRVYGAAADIRGEASGSFACDIERNFCGVFKSNSRTAE